MAGVPIGAKGWDTIVAPNPADNSLFGRLRPSVATKSERTLFLPSPLAEAEFLLELAETVELCGIERGFLGGCHKK